MNPENPQPATAAKVRSGARLRMARLAVQAVQKIGHGDFCKAMAINPQTLSNYETGDRWPSHTFLIHLHDRFGVTADFILTGSMKGLPAELIKEVVNLESDI